MKYICPEEIGVGDVVIMTDETGYKTEHLFHQTSKAKLMPKVIHQEKPHNTGLTTMVRELSL